MSLELVTSKLKVLETTNKQVTKVIHLADIHIRKVRATEYRQVFERTFKKIKNIIGPDLDKSLIVICGDITDNKLILTPVIIELLKEFFIGLSELAEIVVTLGNHDVSISNKDSLDAITPILMNLETDNKIFVLTQNKVYIYANLLLGVTTLYAKKVTVLDQDIINEHMNKIKIALYHGTIKGCKSETGFEFTNSGYFKLSDFTKYYDYGFFGDIHKFQYLNENKTFAYCSSLIEQRISEANDNHGFLYWNLEDETSTFVKVKNDYKYVILKIQNESNNESNNCTIKVITENGEFNYDPKLFPKYPKIRLYYDNVSLSQVSKIEEMIKKNHNVTEFIKMNNISDKLELDYGLDLKDEEKIVEIKDYSTIEKLVGGFIKKNYKEWPKSKVQNIFDLLKDIVKNINISAHEKRVIKLGTLEFDNLFSYGKNNKLDFGKLKKNKITGILGQNGHGKSTLIDSILYAIYDKFSKGENNDALNVNENMASSKITLTVDTDEYIIERKLKRAGKKISPVLQLYKNNVIVTNDRKSETMKDIQDYICKYEDIVDNNIILQNCENFLDMSDVRKRDYIYRILNLDIFNDIVKETNSKKGIVTALKNAKINNLKKYSEVDIISKLEILKQELKYNDEQMKILLGHVEEKSGRLLKLKISIGNIKDTKNDKNIVDIEKNKIIKLKMIADLEMDLNMLKDNSCKLDKKIVKLSKMVELYVDIENKHEQFLEDKHNKLNSLGLDRDELLKSIVSVVPINKNDNSESKLILIKNKLIELQNENIKLKNKIVIVDKESEAKIIDSYNYNVDLELQIKNLDKSLIDINNKLNIYKKKLLKVEQHKYDKNCKYCMSSEMTKDKIYYNEQIEEQMNEQNNNVLLKESLLKQLDPNICSKYDKLVANKDNNEIYKIKMLGHEHSIDILKKDIEILENKVQIINENIKNIEQNKIIELKIDDIDKHIKIVNLELDEEYLKYLEIDKMLNNFKNECAKLEKDIFMKEKLLDKYKNEYLKLEKEYNDNIDNVERIKNMKNVVELEKDIEKIKLDMDKYNNNDVSKMIVENECSINMINELKGEIEEYVLTYDTYTQISNIIETKYGLVNHIMNNIVLVQIESKVNSVLNLLTDFTIELEYNNKRIVVYKVEDNNRIKATSLCGYERFVCNMVFRIVFNQINCKVRCDFLIIDEGFSCCDQENLVRLKSLFDLIREKYKWCLVITHLDTIKDYFDEQLNIDKIGGKSSISF